jgi:hypothetical protein
MHEALVLCLFEDFLLGVKRNDLLSCDGSVVEMSDSERRRSLSFLRDLEVPERWDRGCERCAQLILFIAVDVAEVRRILRGDKERNRFLGFY